MAEREPIWAATSDWTTHIGGYAGIALTAFMAVVAWVFSPLISICIGVAALIGFAMLELVRRADRLVLYEDGVAREYRLFSTKRIFAEYESIQDIEITQNLIERLIGVGTIHINTAGSAGQEIVFHGIPRCADVEAAIRSRMEPDRKVSSVDTPSA